eukprot:CFRG3918T1
MKSVIGTLALVASATSYRMNYRLENEIIDHVNTHPESTWIAGENENFRGWTVDEMMSIMGTTVDEHGPMVMTDLGLDDVFDSLPEHYDSRDKHGHCIHAVRNQAKCGSCWAFGASEALSDRFCMAGQDVVLSPQYLVSCDPVDLGCSGGRLLTVWEYMRFHGLPSDKCDPYTSGDSEVSGTCPSKCKDNKEIKWHKAASAYPIVTFFDSGPIAVKKMMAEIYKNGPIEAAYMVYQDFMSYKGGVYRHMKGPLMGGHAIKIVGWGTDKIGGDYWIVQNSWGPNWGLNGFFWIARGSNECNLESNAWAGMPLIE